MHPWPRSPETARKWGRWVDKYKLLALVCTLWGKPTSKPPQSARPLRKGQGLSREMAHWWMKGEERDTDTYKDWKRTRSGLERLGRKSGRDTKTKSRKSVKVSHTISFLLLTDHDKLRFDKLLHCGNTHEWRRDEHERKHNDARGGDTSRDCHL